MLQLLHARLDGLLERAPRLVGGAADGAALLGRQLGDAAQQVRQLRLAAEHVDPDLLEGVAVGGGGDRGLPLVAQLGDPVKHGAPFSPTSYSATVAAIAGVERFGADRDVRDLVAGRHDAGRQPLPLGPDDQGQVLHPAPCRCET